MGDIQLQSRWLTTLVVSGRSFTFQTFSGGHVTSEAVTSRPPSAKYPRKGGGEPELAAITIGKDYDETVDGDMIAFLQQFVSVEDAATVQRQPLDRNRNPYGRKRGWTALITAVNEPDSDTNTTSDKSQVTVELDPSSKF